MNSRKMLKSLMAIGMFLESEMVHLELSLRVEVEKFLFLKSNDVVKIPTSFKLGYSDQLAGLKPKIFIHARKH